MADARRREVEQDEIARRILADPPDHLDGRARNGRATGNRRAEATGNDPDPIGRAMGLPTTTITGEAYSAG